MVAARPAALQLQIYVLSNLLISHRGNFSRTRGQQISLCWAVALGKHHWLAFQSELGDKSDSSQLSAVRTAAGVIITVHVSEGGRVPVSSAAPELAPCVSTLTPTNLDILQHKDNSQNWHFGKTEDYRYFIFCW